jgi:hypothetical protein
MKQFKQLFALVLILGSLLGNAVNSAAQLPDITAKDPYNYQNGVEKFIGGVIPASTDNVIKLSNVGFIAPAGVTFTDASYNLSGSSLFTLTDVSLNATNDTLLLTVNFTVPLNTSYGEYTSTLTISASGANSFVLPLKGASAPFTASTHTLFFNGYTLPGDISEPDTLKVKTVGIFSTSGFTYTFAGGAGSEFSAQGAGSSPNYLVKLFFAPASAEALGYVEKTDTLLLSHQSYPWLVYKIPVVGYASHVATDLTRLDFNKVPVDSTKTLKVSVKTDTEITSVGVDPAYYSYAYGPGWDPSVGGDIYVTVTPDTLGYATGVLTIKGNNADSVTVFLYTLGVVAPTLTVTPDEIDFEEVPVGSEETAIVSITLSDPVEHLDNSDFSIVDNPGGVFKIKSVQVNTTVHSDNAQLTVAFTPNSEDIFDGKLLVCAAYTEGVDVTLTGSGAAAQALSPRQATAISGGAAAAVPSVSVKGGGITVSQAPAGSSIEVYNLQGQRLKTQAVTSGVETVKTAQLPKSVYIVVVNGSKQEILKQKVVL